MSLGGYRSIPCGQQLIKFNLVQIFLRTISQFYNSGIWYFFIFSKTLDDSEADKENPNRRFLQCPGSVTVQLLKKFIMTKYSLDQNFLVDVIYKEDLLPEENTLIDVAYSYNWRKVRGELGEIRTWIYYLHFRPVPWDSTTGSIKRLKS